MKKRKSAVKKQKFGKELILDLRDCDPSVIRSRVKLKKYVTELCKLIKMKTYGPTRMPHFGHDDPKTSGYSLLQFIETSSITGHFAELTNTAYLNIFSCAPFDAKKTREFSVKYFKAKRVSHHLIIRK